MIDERGVPIHDYKATVVYLKPTDAGLIKAEVSYAVRGTDVGEAWREADSLYRSRYPSRTVVDIFVVKVGTP